MATLLRRIAVLEARARELELEVAREQRIAGLAPAEAGLFFGAYAQAARKRRERIATARAQTEQALSQAQEELREAYRDLKKYEVAQASRDAAEARDSERRAQNELDEIGLQVHRRRR